MSDETSKDSNNRGPRTGVTITCAVCDRVLVDNGTIEAAPKLVAERFRTKGGGVILNAGGQPMIEQPYVCPDNFECYRQILADEGWKKATAMAAPGPVPSLPENPARRHLS